MYSGSAMGNMFLTDNITERNCGIANHAILIKSSLMGSAPTSTSIPELTSVFPGYLSQLQLGLRLKLCWRIAAAAAVEMGECARSLCLDRTSRCG